MCYQVMITFFKEHEKEGLPCKLLHACKHYDALLTVGGVPPLPAGKPGGESGYGFGTGIHV